MTAPAPGPAIHERRRDWARAAALLLLVLLAYTPTYRNPAGWIWDDDHYVTRNTKLRTAAGLKDIWIHPTASPQYYPATMTSLWLEYQLWQHDARPYHTTNALLHAGCAILLWLTLRRLAVPGAWTVAALWALHPVNVESVAWVTERKNVLSALFYLAALLAYLRVALPTQPTQHCGPAADSPPLPSRERVGVRGDRSNTNVVDAPKTASPSPGTPGEGRGEGSAQPAPNPATSNPAPSTPPSHSPAYYLSLLLFTLALLSKTVACSLPAAILLILYWKRPRLGPADVLPLLPFFALGLLAGLSTAYLEVHHVGAAGDEFNYSPLDRLLIASRAAAFYAAKTLLSLNLSFVYPKWPLHPRQLLFLIPLLTALALVWSLRHRVGRGPLAGLLFFLGTLFPALGFVDVYPMRFSFVADHFQYLAMPGLLALAVAIAAHVLPRTPRRLAAAAALAAFFLMTFQRSAVFASAESLWTDTIAKNPSAWMARTHLGILHLDRAEAKLAAGQSADTDLTAAAAQFAAVQKLRPDLPEAYMNLARVAEFSRDPAAAESLLRQAVTVAPDSAETHFQLARFLASTGRPDDATREYERAISLNPRHEPAHVNLGSLHADRGQWDRAILLYRQALDIDPDSVFARTQLAIALAETGHPTQAASELRRVLAIEPTFPPALQALRALESPPPPR